MEIKQVDKYEKPKFNTFQLKTGKVLLAGAACLALLGISSTLGSCRYSGGATEAITGTSAAQDFSVERPSDNLVVPPYTEAVSPLSQTTPSEFPEITMGYIATYP
ncbi:MAG: hypothetical protein FWC25_02395 [Dehalococcoidia bacterium]|nr:hypothetical protein [Dehalococcoidia bacterium]